MSEPPPNSIAVLSWASRLRVAGAAGIGGLAAALVVKRGQSGELVWQLDPHKCVSCGNCATYCVLDESAVKCVHSFPMCGYCDLCTGYFQPSPIELKTGAENQLCPTGAIQRQFIEDPYFEYTIDQGALHRLRQVRERLQRLRQRFALFAGAARPLQKLQRMRDRRLLPLAGVQPRSGRRCLSLENSGKEGMNPAGGRSSPYICEDLQMNCLTAC